MPSSQGLESLQWAEITRAQRESRRESQRDPWGRPTRWSVSSAFGSMRDDTEQESGLRELRSSPEQRWARTCSARTISGITRALAPVPSKPAGISVSQMLCCTEIHAVPYGSEKLNSFVWLKSGPLQICVLGNLNSSMQPFWEMGPCVSQLLTIHMCAHTCTLSCFSEDTVLTSFVNWYLNKIWMHVLYWMFTDHL